MKILVVGASGLVGGNCFRAARSAGHEVLGTFHRYAIEGLVPLDVASEAAVTSVFDQFAPDAVIYCAAWSWVDGCEADPERAFRENSEHPARMARLADRAHLQMVHFSTSYVFDGREGPYAEDAPPNPISVYGRAKLAGENAVRDETGGRAIIARTMGVYGEEAQRKNFVYQVRDRLSSGQRMRVPSDQFGNASYAGDLAEAVIRLLARNASGIWNLAGPDPHLCRKDLAIRIAGEYGLDQSLFDFVPTVDLGQPAQRPRQGGLLINRLRRELEMEPAAWVRIP